VFVLGQKLEVRVKTMTDQDVGVFAAKVKYKVKICTILLTAK